MILEIQDDGLTVVSITSKESMIYVVSAIVGVMRQIPDINNMVSAIMTENLDMARLGVDVGVVKCNSEEDQKQKIAMIKERREPANAEDVPEFVKRSLEDE